MQTLVLTPKNMKFRVFCFGVLSQNKFSNQRVLLLEYQVRLAGVLVRVTAQFLFIANVV